MELLQETCTEIEIQGFSLLTDVFHSERVAEMLQQIEAGFLADTEFSSIRSSRGTVFAARNVLDVVPEILSLWRSSRLDDVLYSVLGKSPGLVRALYFDKPSHRSWSLPFHKDMTIAVTDNSIPTEHFSKPTRKANVPHVEASTEVLENMLTLRIHLDQVTTDNGPLQVIPGSHSNGKATAGYTGEPKVVTCQAGDVLAMRPLISHASGHSDPEKEMNRRILHLEFSGTGRLPDGYQWKQFIPL